MRQRLSALVLLGGAAGFLASLYLPWQTAGGRSCGRGCYQSALRLDGWSFGVGYAAALVALGLAGVAAAALIRPGRTRRLPLARGGMALCYFALAVGTAVRTEGAVFEDSRHGHWAYGSYLGVACGVLALCAALALRARELARRPSAPDLVSGLLGLGLLIAFLLPWYRSGSAGHVVSQTGIVVPAAMLAALVVVFAVPVARARLAAAVAAALLTVSAVVPSIPWPSHTYGAWLGLGLAVALLAFAAVRAEALRRRPARVDGASIVAAAALLFVASLFLPWQTFCAAPGSGSSGPGVCVSGSGWSEPGSAAALLVLALVAAPVLWRLRAASAEIAVAVALLVATAALSATAFGSARLAYGSFVGFGAAGAFVVLALRRSPVPRLDRSRIGARIVPVAASLLLVLGVLLPWWAVLPSNRASQWGVLVEWPAVAGLLLSLHLLASWLPLAEARPRGDRTLTVVPLALLGLVAVAILRERSQGLTWGGGTMLGLCLFLLLLGWSEDKQRLERLRVPELLRVDRLPGAEA